MFLQAALNGDRLHPGAPRTPDAIARAAVEATAAGAQSVHVHAFDAQGRETLEPDACAHVLRAIRALCPGVPVSLTTSASIVADPARRLELVRGWTELPDLVTANQGEAGIDDLSASLLARNVGIEAGLLCTADARRFITSPLRDHCRRVLIEPLDDDPDAALAHAAEMEAVLAGAGVRFPQVHHGYERGCWPVVRRALARGHGIRVGLEDVAHLPDGQPAADNAALVRAARALIGAT